MISFSPEALYSTKVRLRLSKRGPLFWLYAGGIVVLLVASAFWCYKTSTDPERVFWKTIERGLATRGVTIQGEPNNGTVMQYSLGSSNLAHSITTFSQQGTTVKNEMIGTPTVDYLRYTGIKTDQKKADGSPIDFSKVLGVWAKGEDGDGQFFAQALFGGSLPIGGMGVPIGAVSSESRTILVKQIRNDHVYQISFDKTKKERVHGRLQYTYDVSVQPVAYVALMKHFAQTIGLHGLDQLDPKTYVGQQAFKLQMTVDVRAQQVVRIATDSGTVQVYSGYDVPVQVSVPQKTISGSELQQRLSQLQ